VGILLTVKNDGTLYPLGIKWTGESRFQLMAPTRDKTEETYGDGEHDFGTELGVGDCQLSCVSEEGLTKDEMNTLKATIAGQLNSLREYELLVWESDPGKGLYIRISGTVEFTDHPNWFEATIPIKYQPLWVSVEEQSHIGSGIITNAGTFEAPLVVEITGATTDPTVIVGNKTMVYAGTLAVGDVLVIDTDKQTAKYNGVNAIANYNRVFPRLTPGENSVTAGDNVIIKWRSCWI
jgi:phage-related protein